MTVPEHLWRFPTAAAKAALAERFHLPNHPDMQDWEWEVADASCLDQYLAVYHSGELTDDERFLLMEMMLQAVEDDPQPLETSLHWQEILQLLDRHIDLHAYSVWYWSDLEEELGEETWRITPSLRQLVWRHRPRLDPASSH